MKQLALIVVVFSFVLSVVANDYSKYCFDKNFSFSGYKFQMTYDFDAKTLNYDLIYCMDSKYIYKSTIDSLSKKFTINSDELHIIKNIYKPSHFLMLNGEKFCPMVLDNILRYWVERSDHKVFHVPMLTSPSLTSSYHKMVGRSIE